MTMISLTQIQAMLLEALEDGKEVEDKTVLKIISCLQRMPISQATIGDTKIGKMVNELRKKIKNPKLEKCVKQMVRSWRAHLLNNTPSPILARSTGSILDHCKALSQAVASPSTTEAVHNGLSPALPGDRPKASPPVSSVFSTPLKSAGTLGISSSPSSTKHAASGRVASPAVSGRVASPALSGRSASPAVSGRSASPAVSERSASPAVSGRSASPAVSGRSASPAVSGRSASPAVSGRSASPAVSGRFASLAVSGCSASPAVSECSASPAVSKSTLTPTAALTTRQENPPSLAGHRLRKRVPSSEDERTGLVFPSANVDKLDQEVKQGRCSSDGEPWCSSALASHSTKQSPSLTVSSSQNCVRDQRELRKTNMDSRKSTHEMSDSPLEDNGTKLGSRLPSLSVSSCTNIIGINGLTLKFHKKAVSKLEGPQLNAVTSTPSVHKQGSSSLMLKSDNSASISHSRSGSPTLYRRKVKTTAELIQDLQKKNGSCGQLNNIMSKLHDHQINPETNPFRMKPQGKRGRPRKNDTPVSPSNGKQKGKRGRPRKNDTPVSPSNGKPQGKRGRPRKNDTPVSPSNGKPQGKRGRPRKNDTPVAPSNGKQKGKRGRPRKNDTPVSPSNGKVRQVKNELVEPFVHTSDQAQSAEPGVNEGDSRSASRQDLSAWAKEDNKESSSLLYSPSTPQPERTGSDLTEEEIYAQLPPINWDAVPVFELPEEFPVTGERVPVTEESVDSLHNKRRPGVNGMYDINGDWTRWQDMLTLPSYEGKPLHILPYVNLK